MMAKCSYLILVDAGFKKLLTRRVASVGFVIYKQSNLMNRVIMQKSQPIQGCEKSSVAEQKGIAIALRELNRVVTNNFSGVVEVKVYGDCDSVLTGFSQGTVDCEESRYVLTKLFKDVPLTFSHFKKHIPFHNFNAAHQLASIELIKQQIITESFYEY